MPDPQQVQQHADYVDPIPQHEWTPDRGANAVSGLSVMPESDYPVDGPYPAIDPDGRTFVPGRGNLLTVHTARGRDLINEPDTINRELSRHHWGYFTVIEVPTADGGVQALMAPVVFSMPDNDDGTVFASVGYFTVRGTAVDDPNEPRADDDLLSQVAPGRMCAVNSLQLPEHIEAMFDNATSVCGVMPT